MAEPTPQRHGESGMALAKRLKETEARVVELQEALRLTLDGWKRERGDGALPSEEFYLRRDNAENLLRGSVGDSDPETDR